MLTEENGNESHRRKENDVIAKAKNHCFRWENRRRRRTESSRCTDWIEQTYAGLGELSNSDSRHLIDQWGGGEAAAVTSSQAMKYYFSSREKQQCSRGTSIRCSVIWSTSRRNRTAQKISNRDRFLRLAAATTARLIEPSISFILFLSSLLLAENRLEYFPSSSFLFFFFFFALPR